MIEYVYGNIKLSNDEYENYITLDGEEFLLSYLNPGKPYNKGASSNLFILIDPNGDTEDRVIKICKTPYHKYSKDRSILRFKREERAFRTVEREGADGVIGFYSSGVINLAGIDFLYLILEKADNDLASYMEENKFAFTSNQKLNFCIRLLASFKRLHELGIYHRDIKHDNILVVGGELKIGDLGLITFQDRDYGMDRDNEKIGPAGWLCPEATNKMLTYRKNIGNVYDCVIDHQSDIFQLGKLFWYIFQGNIPTGQVQSGDRRFAEQDIYEVVFSMIQYDKIRRPTIDQINVQMAPIAARLFV